MKNFRTSRRDAIERGPGRTTYPSCVTREPAKARITFIADGNFGFKRFSNYAGKIGDSFLKTSFYVKKSGLIYPAFSRTEAECSKFRSGDELTKKAAACDVCGLNVSICSHSIP